MSFSVSRIVRFQDCDPAGIVFYPRYFEMLNATVEDWFAARLDLPWKQLHMDRRSGVPAVRIETQFVSPSRLGELLDFTLQVHRVGTSSLDVAIDVSCGAQARLSFSATLVHFDIDSGSSAPWPASLRSRMEAELNSEHRS